MSFLGLFKSKREKDFDKIKENLFNKAFPGGQKQIDDEVGEIGKLLGSKYSIDLLNKVYTHMTFIFVISQDKTEERILKSVKMRMGNKVAAEDILKIYQYITKKILKQSLGIENEAFLDFISDGVFGEKKEGCDSDEIPGGFGDFGLSSTNPIPTCGIAGSNSYLSKLKSIDDKEIKWSRIGVCFADNIENVIDEYKLFNVLGEFIATIYISPYHKKNSKKVPSGFKLI